MEFSKQTQSDLVAYRADLLKRIDEFQRRISEYQDKVRAIDLIFPRTESGGEESAPVIVDKVLGTGSMMLQGLKQMPALKTIARANNGLVRTLEAKDLMVKAGVMKDSKNAYKMVYNLIKNSEDFEPTGNRGEYRMTEAVRPVVQ
jgi:hypothetical protein